MNLPAKREQHRVITLGALWLTGAGASLLVVGAVAGGGAATLLASASLVTELPLVLAWVVAAFGLGWPLRRALLGSGRASPRTAALQVGLGIAAALAVDAALGALGILGPIPAWSITLAGGVLALLCAWRDPPRCAPMSPLVLGAAPAVGVLLLAATSEPGWLWSTEFGGYDALSYHLQLPKEWLLAGRIGATPHCVYGHLPSFMEAAFLRLMELRGALHERGASVALHGAVAGQLLHAVLALLTAWCAGQAAAAWLASTSQRSTAGETPAAGGAGGEAAIAAAVTAALVLVTPWVVVVGSLAYSEMPAMLLLATGLVALRPTAADNFRGHPSTARGEGAMALSADLGIGEPQRGQQWIRLALLTGVLAGGACGSKLTASVFVAVPLGALLLWSLPRRRWASASAWAIGAALVLLSPWLLRNWMTTGNPLFPFATGLFGTGPWSDEQAAIFARGHASDLGVLARLRRLWEQVMIFGVGQPPAPGEPWRLQWGVTPWLAASALALLWLPATRRDAAPPQTAGAAEHVATSCWRAAAKWLTAVLLIQILAWLALTHLQSRFLLPAVIPMAIASALALLRAARFLELPRTAPNRRASWNSGHRSLPTPAQQAAPIAALGALAGGLSLLPISIFLKERGGAPMAAIGARPIFSGEGVPGSSAEEIPAHWLNQRLPRGTRVLLVGDARPFWYLGEPASYVWQTTWDRGPISAVLADHPGNPALQRAALSAQGFTHLLLDPAMLDRWRRSGWNDPRLTPESMADLIEGLPVIKRFPGGALLVLLDRG